MERVGNRFELHLFEGRRHYLGEGSPKYSRYFDDAILATTDDFLRRNRLLE